MARARYALAKQEAERLLQLSGARTPGEIDPTRIAEEICKADVREGSFNGDMIGVLIREPGATPIIGVEQNIANEGRKRFTIAHELGHLLLHNEPYHYDKQIYMRNSESSLAESVLEIEANQFASNLLMPAWMLRRDIDGKDVDEVVTEELADRYGVSHQAMTLRLSKLLKYNL